MISAGRPSISLSSQFPDEIDIGMLVSNEEGLSLGSSRQAVPLRGYTRLSRRFRPTPSRAKNRGAIFWWAG